MGAPSRADDTTVRIDKRTSAILDDLAKASGRAKKEIIQRAVERMRREEILEAANAGYAVLKSDPIVWQQEQEERALWDRTNSDGLKSE